MLLDTHLQPRLHGDPFDHLLLAQADTEGMTLVARDRWWRYGVAILEATDAGARDHARGARSTCAWAVFGYAIGARV